MSTLLGLSLLAAAAITGVSAEPQVDFKHYSMKGCSKNGGTQIGDVDHLEANEDIKNFDDDGEPVFNSFMMTITEDEDEVNEQYFEITVCENFDCEGGRRISVGSKSSLLLTVLVLDPAHQC